MKAINFDRSAWDRHRTKAEKEAFRNKHELVQVWLEDVDEDTQDRYLREFMKFTETVKMTPLELTNLKEQIKTIKDKFNAERLVKRYLQVLYDNDIEPFNSWITIASFYSRVSNKLNGKKIPAQLRTFHRKKKKLKITPQMVLDFSKGASVRDKTIISMESCFPARRETVTKMLWLDVEDYFSEQDPKTGKFTKRAFHIGIIDQKRLKKTQSGVSAEQHSFAHSWFKENLDEWFEEYKRITGKDPSKNLRLPLFIQTKGQNKGKAISLDALDRAMRARKRDTKVPLTIKMFRSYVNTRLKGVLDKEDRNILLHHVPKQVDEAYDFEHLDEIKEALILHGFAKIDPTYREQDTVVKMYRELVDKGMSRISLEDFRKAFAHSQALFKENMLEVSRS